MTTLRVTAEHFVAGLETDGEHVIDAEPILKYTVGWDRKRFVAYIKQRGWKVEKIDAAPGSSPDGPSKARGARLSPAWAPTGDLLAWIRNERPDLLAGLTGLVEEFRDYWTAESGQRASKRDWDATFRNWCRRQKVQPMPPKPAVSGPVPSGPSPLIPAIARLSDEERAKNRERLAKLIQEALGK